MFPLPAPELVKVLESAYSPCLGFGDSCCGVAKWSPEDGYVPRGFIGAFGKISEVEVLVMVAEPGDSYGSDPFPQDASPDELIRKVCQYTWKHISEGRDLYHRNIRQLFNLLYPDIDLKSQLRRIWLTETFLCSAPKEGGAVPRRAEIGCAERYLVAQLRLLKGLPVIALGGKAQKRAHKYEPNLIKAFSVAPPGCNQRGARPSWERAAQEARRRITAQSG